MEILNDRLAASRLNMIFRYYLGTSNVSRFSSIEGDVYVHLRVSEPEGLCHCFNVLGRHGAKFGTTDILDSKGKISHIQVHINLKESENLREWLAGRF